MSFFNKIIDKAKHSRHQDKSTSSSTSSQETDVATVPETQLNNSSNNNNGNDSNNNNNNKNSSSMDTATSETQLENTNKPKEERPRASNLTTVYNDQTIIKQRQDRPRLKLDDFNILRTLGTGSFGRVHLVQSRVNKRYYAIKVLKKSEVVRLKQIEHTNNEKHILESVAHPFLINMWVSVRLELSDPTFFIIVLKQRTLHRNILQGMNEYNNERITK